MPRYVRKYGSAIPKAEPQKFKKKFDTITAEDVYDGLLSNGYKAHRPNSSGWWHTETSICHGGVTEWLGFRDNDTGTGIITSCITEETCTNQWQPLLEAAGLWRS